MKTNFDFQKVKSFINEKRKDFTAFLSNFHDKIKKSCERFKKSSPYYGMRASLAFILSLYSIYLLKCFLTIPVKDYYFDVYANSPDSVVAQIDFTIGNKNVLNTYSSHDTISIDECTIYYTLYKYNSTFHSQYHNKYFLSEETKKFIHLLDSIRFCSSQDSIYAELLKNYSSHVHNMMNDTLFTYIYTHTYHNYASSNPVGMISFSDFYRREPNIYPQKCAKSQKMCKAPFVHFIESPLLDSLFLPIFLDTTSYKKLSLNHRYVSSANIQYLHSISSVQDDISYGKVNDMKITNSHALPQPQYSAWLKTHPVLLLLLSKEDVSQVNYRFYFNGATIKNYMINIHNRGCAIINNNPSDELKVLSLHDTQIVKNKNKAYYYAKNFSESEILASFPENNAIQYARLFFVTLIIGWLIHAFLKNAWSFVKHKYFKSFERNVK